MGLALLAGDGLATTLGWLKDHRPSLGGIPTVGVLGALCLVVAVVEGAANMPSHPVRTGQNLPEVYQWLAKQPTPGPIVEIPIDTDGFRESPRSYYSTYDHQPLVDGARSFVPPAYASLAADLASFPSSRAISTAQLLGVRYLIVHRDELSPVEQQRLDLAPPSLPIVARFGEDCVYAIGAPTEPEVVSVEALSPSFSRPPDSNTVIPVVLERTDNGHSLIFSPGTQELNFRLRWVGRNGEVYAETSRVPVSAPVVSAPLAVNLVTSTPPTSGEYSLSAALLDQPTISPVTTSATARVGSAQPVAGEPVPRLIQANLPPSRTTAQAGVAYELNWLVTARPNRSMVAFVNVYDARSVYWSFPRGTETRFTSAETTAGQIIAEADTVPIKPDTPPGHYWVEAGLLDPATNQRVPFVGPNGDQVNRVVVGSFWLLPPNVIPSGDTSNSAPDARVFGDQIALDSAQVVGTPQPGGKLRVDLRWSAKAAPKADYTAFVHVVDASGKLIAQVDAQPTAGVYPTSAWLPGDTIIDTMNLQLPANLPPGPYQVQIGLYDLKTMQRLPVTTAGGIAQGDVVTLRQ